MKRPTISFLTHNLTDLYGQILLAGISDSACDHDVNLQCFVGRDLNSPRSYDVQANIIYKLAAQNKVDGIIYSGGIVSNFTSREQVENFYHNYPNIPKMSIAVPLKDVPSVLIDNSDGMKSMIRHLIEVHGYHKIAYINGPQENIEVYQRYNSYCEVLKKFNISINPNLVIEGDFEPRSGYQAVQTLLDERQVKFDAIVASNDNMAIGALEALIQRGISVPYDVAVVGFDDFPTSALVTPPLTTVRQPIYEMARKAMDLLIDQIQYHNSIPHETYFPTELMIRESCGCFPYTKKSTSIIDQKNQPDIPKLSDINMKDLFISLKNECQHEVSQQNLNRLNLILNELLQDLNDLSSTNFIQALNIQLQQTILESKDLSDWPIIIIAIRKYFLPLLLDRTLLLRFIELLDQARQLIADASQRIISLKKSLQEKEANIIRDVSETLIMNFNFDQLTSLLKRELHRLNIESCYMVLYEQGRLKSKPKHNPAKWSRLRLAFHCDQEYEIEEQGIKFQSHELIPAKYLPLDQQFTIIIEPLYFRTEHFGYVIFGAAPSVSGLTYEALRGQISSALKGTQLFQDLYLAKKDIEDYAKKLQQSNRELEQFAYVTSHDLQEPLRMISAYGGLLERNIQESLDSESKEFLFFMMDGAKRMQQLINDLLIYSRVTSKAKAFEEANLKEIVDHSLSNLKVRIDEQNAQITQGELPIVMCDPVQYERLIQNLVENAIKYCKTSPKVHIAAYKEDKTWVISVKDNGIGIDSKYNNKIFGIFQRLHNRNEFSGTGIGLAVCKKIVERHGGQIWVESEVDKGSTFHFSIPVH
ncbi:substrate-binding domain-containing protein [bacterium]